MCKKTEMADAELDVDNLISRLLEGNYNISIICILYIYIYLWTFFLLKHFGHF